MASTMDWDETVCDEELVEMVMEVENQHWDLSDEQLIEAILDLDTTFDETLFDDIVVSQPSQFGDEELIEFVLNYDTSLDFADEDMIAKLVERYEREDNTLVAECDRTF